MLVAIDFHKGEQDVITPSSVRCQADRQRVCPDLQFSYSAPVDESVRAQPIISKVKWLWKEDVRLTGHGAAVDAVQLRQGSDDHEQSAIEGSMCNS